MITDYHKITFSLLLAIVAYFRHTINNSQIYPEYTCKSQHKQTFPLLKKQNITKPNIYEILKLEHDEDKQWWSVKDNFTVGSEFVKNKVMNVPSAQADAC